MSEQSRKHRYLFGPVPSRRLGKSLGVDIVPFKTCTQNCLYCQLGKDAATTLERKAYVPIDEVLEELKAKLDSGLEADYITISGSGEPTLHSELGTLIDRIRKLTTIPVAIITNGTLLSRPDVRGDCAKADVVLPSLDAGDAETFKIINQPHRDLDYDTFVEGLRQFRAEYSGSIWLEVFFCKGINTDEASIEKMKRQIESIRPDRIQLNTAVRPTAHREAAAVSPDELQAIADHLGPHAEVIADFPKDKAASEKLVTPQQVYETLHRRPCTLEDLTASLGISADLARACLEKLTHLDHVYPETRQGKTYYIAR